MFEKAKQVQRFFKVALFGDKKVGKTRFALSFPKPCMIDTERGSLMYAEKYEFDFKDANHWPELLGILDWLERGQHQYQTLAIDSLTIFYQDLINMQVQSRRNRSGNEILVHADWGIVKRRWGNFMNRLIDLNMHVVLTMREKDQYEEYQDPRTGEDKRRKTGEHIPEADKSTGYIFDVTMRCHVDANKKEKTCRHLVTCEGSRVDGIQQFATYDITEKHGYAEIFKPVEKKALTGDVAPPRDTPKETVPTTGAPATEEPPATASPPTDPTPAAAAAEATKARTAGKGRRRVSVTPAATAAPEVEPLPPPNSAIENAAEITRRFGTGVSSDQPEASAEDFKVLFTRAGQMTWPDGSPFTSADGKTLIQTWYKVESAKELRKPQVDFLFEEFGKVLAGRAFLSRDEKGIPFVAQKSEVKTGF